MDRSPGFGSTPHYLSPYSDSLSLRLHLRLTLHYRVTRWPVMQKARCHGTSPLQQLVGTWFQVLFHSPNRGSFHLSLTVLSTIGHLGVFSLGRWSSRLHTGFHVSRATLDNLRRLSLLPTRLLLSMADLPRSFG